MTDRYTFAAISFPSLWPWLAGSLPVIGILAIIYFGRKPRFMQQSLMTDNEREFYRHLIAAFPGCQIWPQVPILAMLRPDAKNGSRAFWRGFRMISNARVDWVLLKDLEILAIIELDDRTHDPRKDAKRDQILAFCGYKVVRFNSRRRPTPEQIRRAVSNAKG
ncbi:DUF2726 domain-containing protein [Microvirga aerophila]|uniref:DUF2726 domain-containing protein n=1 Tax=Microvirga aerophila TaxID=670291 RepID=A0A512C455_9HYPH|nr:DUF2726 domain-containing protein [Microvirga aerophila]GEO19001.1 hypothetical protein MAE02_66970 [Microvirga aerophila]